MEARANLAVMEDLGGAYERLSQYKDQLGRGKHVACREDVIKLAKLLSVLQVRAGEAGDGAAFERERRALGHFVPVVHADWALRHHATRITVCTDVRRVV